MSLAEREDMTIDEAIKYLRMATDEAGSEEFSDVYKEMCSMSINALEKQSSKKPYIEEHDYGKAYVCAICETFIHYVDDDEEHLRFDYCPSCGRKIEW